MSRLKLVATNYKGYIHLRREGGLVKNDLHLK